MSNETFKIITRPVEAVAALRERMPWLSLEQAWSIVQSRGYASLAKQRRVPGADDLITCTRCYKALSPYVFSPDRRKLNGLQSWCTDCRAEHARSIRAQRRPQS